VFRCRTAKHLEGDVESVNARTTMPRDVRSTSCARRRVDRSSFDDDVATTVRDLSRAHVRRRSRRFENQRKHPV